MGNKTTGVVETINGNMVAVKVNGPVRQNEVGYILKGQERLKAEVIKIRQDIAFMQIFEYSKGIRIEDKVEFSGEMLSVHLGPGLLGKVYDGLQNPLNLIAEEHGFFLPRGKELPALDENKKWHFTPLVQKGQTVKAGNYLGFVPEGIFQHYIMVPFYLRGNYTVKEIVQEADYSINEVVARLEDERNKTIEISMQFSWPVKIPITAYRKKIVPRLPLSTRIRLIDTFFPVAKGGTYCVPGPFGAGKTVLQQLISRYAQVDVVIIAACGERAGEVVETLREFPKIEDPRTGKSLMDRTIIICNTSSMPVAAREASVYTATTLGEYYRQMGLDVLLLADSTSRWAQAMREVSGRLEEIPGEEAFPAYLESRIAEFYERAGCVELLNNKQGSLTIGGTVSPAGGNFEEPVTQATLKVVGAFHGLSRDRANARKFPSIDPLESWSRYTYFIHPEEVKLAKQILHKGHEVEQMMKVVGEEGTSLEDFIIYLKAQFLDDVYLQQNGFDPIDAATSEERQEYVFGFLANILKAKYKFTDKEEARHFFYELRQIFIDWNYKPWDSEEFRAQEDKIKEKLEGKISSIDQEKLIKIEGDNKNEESV